MAADMSEARCGCVASISNVDSADNDMDGEHQIPTHIHDRCYGAFGTSTRSPERYIQSEYEKDDVKLHATTAFLTSGLPQIRAMSPPFGQRGLVDVCVSPEDVPVCTECPERGMTGATILLLGWSTGINFFYFIYHDRRLFCIPDGRVVKASDSNGRRSI
jgi:hypothetical protein